MVLLSGNFVVLLLLVLPTLLSLPTCFVVVDHDPTIFCCSTCYADFDHSMGSLLPLMIPSLLLFQWYSQYLVTIGSDAGDIGIPCCFIVTIDTVNIVVTCW